MSHVRSARSRWAVLAAVTASLLLLTGCAAFERGGPGLAPPPSATVEGEDVQTLYQIVFWVGAAIFVFVEALIIWAVIRYRRAHTATLPPQTHGNKLLEIAWTVVPLAIVLFLFFATLPVIGSVDAVSETRPPVTVRVQGFQWQWTFSYPNEQGAGGAPLSFTGTGSDGPKAFDGQGLRIPTDEEVRFELEAQDVIHAFYVPEFLHKKDMIPGRVNVIEVRVKEPGTYTGQCAEFCGLDHAKMFFQLVAVPRPEYEAWIAAERERASQTPPPAPSGAQVIDLTSPSVAGFDKESLSAPADAPFQIRLRNTDPAVPHNLALRQGGALVPGPEKILNPGEEVVYNAPALPAGRYEYLCTLHPTTMVGTLTTE